MSSTSLAPERFRSAHMKVDRARHHLADLTTLVTDYLSSNPVKLIWTSIQLSDQHSTYYEPGTPLIGLVVRVERIIPETFAPLIGDIIHNLRSALDHMMCEIVAKADPAVDINKVCFPTWSSPERRTKALSRSKAKFATAQDIALVDMWEPFAGGRSRLYALAQLDNTDKHRALIPSMNAVAYSQARSMLQHEIRAEEMTDSFLTKRQAVDGHVFSVGPADVMPLAGTEVQCECKLGLDGVEDIKGHDLIHELNWQTEIVSAVLHSFEFRIEPEFVPRSPLQPVEVGSGFWAGPPGMSPEEVFANVRSQFYNDDRMLTT